MSGLCAIADLAGDPVERADLLAMVEACRERGPDGVAHLYAGSFACAHLALHVTPESSGEGQPLTARDGRLVVVADARLDNRSELARALDLDPVPGDAAILLAAYRRWGRGCAERLLGDFAFLVWDRSERRLFAARDPLGVRQLCYARRGSRLVLASSAGAVAAALGSAPELNRELLQDFLAGRLDRWVHETACREVLRLPPAHLLEADSRGVELARYWVLGARPAPRYRRDEEYAEHLLDLLRSAMASRLRSRGAAAILVSGGLDSSSLACLADALVAAGEVLEPPRLYSCVFDRHPSADERPFLEAVLARCPRLPSRKLPADDAWGLKELGTDGGYRADEPEISGDRALLLRPVRAARADGCKAVLWGYGGDQILGGDAYAKLALLRDVPWYRLPAELRYFGGLRRLSSRLAPAPLAAVWRGRRREGRGVSPAPLAPPSSNAVVDWLPPPDLGSFGARSSYRSLTAGAFAAQLATLDGYAAHAGVEVAFPYLDRRLVDYLLALPSRFRFRAGLEKALLRSAMRELLPASVLTRSGYSHFTDLMIEGLRDRERCRVEALLDGSRLERLGLVDGERLRRTWIGYVDGRISKYFFQGLLRAVCLEAWLRDREERGSRERGIDEHRWLLA